MPFWSKSKKRRARTPPPNMDRQGQHQPSGQSSPGRSLFGLKRRSPSPFVRRYESEQYVLPPAPTTSSINSTASSNSQNYQPYSRGGLLDVPIPGESPLSLDLGLDFAPNRSRSPAPSRSRDRRHPRELPEPPTSIVVVTSTGPSCVIQCSKATTVQDALDQASRSLPAEHSKLVEARAPDGRKARVDEKVLDVCGPNKILVVTVGNDYYSRRASADSPRGYTLRRGYMDRDENLPDDSDTDTGSRPRPERDDRLPRARGVIPRASAPRRDSSNSRHYRYPARASSKHSVTTDDMSDSGHVPPLPSQRYSKPSSPAPSFGLPRIERAASPPLLGDLQRSRDSRLSRASRNSQEGRTNGWEEKPSRPNREDSKRSSARTSGLDSVMEDLARMADFGVDSLPQSSTRAVDEPQEPAFDAPARSSSHFSRRSNDVDSRLIEILNSVGMEIDDALGELSMAESLSEPPSPSRSSMIEDASDIDDSTRKTNHPKYRSRRLTKISKASAMDILTALEQQETELTSAVPETPVSLSFSLSDDRASRRVSRISRASALSMFASITNSDHDDDDDDSNADNEEDADQDADDETVIGDLPDDSSLNVDPIPTDDAGTLPPMRGKSLMLLKAPPKKVRPPARRGRSSPTSTFNESERTNLLDSMMIPNPTPAPAAPTDTLLPPPPAAPLPALPVHVDDNSRTDNSVSMDKRPDETLVVGSDAQAVGLSSSVAETAELKGESPAAAIDSSQTPASPALVSTETLAEAQPVPVLILPPEAPASLSGEAPAAANIPPPPPPPPVMTFESSATGPPPPPPPPPVMTFDSTSGGPPPPPPPPPVMSFDNPAGGPPPPPPPPPVMSFDNAAGGPPPPPPPPPVMAFDNASGGPPPPPPPGNGPPPPPPPPPPPGGVPPPPPPPPGGVSTPAAPPEDAQSAFLAELRDPNRRKKLRKVTPPARPAIAEQAKAEKQSDQNAAEPAKDEVDRQELYIELLGYMEAPNGNIEELCDKAAKQTNLVRSFAFTLMRKGWVTGYRVTDNLPEVKGRQKRIPIKVWPGREVMMCIELQDITEDELVQRVGSQKMDFDTLTRNTSGEPVQYKGEVARVYMYRFDEKAKQHVMDEVAMVATRSFPKKAKVFDDPEPPQNNFVNRQRWEDWNQRKLHYLQSDWPQFELIFNKLMATSQIVQSTHAQLHQTLAEMRAMGEAMHRTFAGVPVPQLRRIVESIPSRIKEVAQRLQKQNGIIIRDDSLKLTPDFLQRMGLVPDKEEEAKKKEEVKESEQAPPVRRSQDSARETMISIGGVPFDMLLPLLKKSFNRQELSEERMNRRLTL
ncbi:hypothetical protein BC832DRAFT_464939 [Gaertneriomyces semiglobifer]|nr:hypothetical protein BC832DRAFT_464939 [Gaertneriomyces semiglobifer]